MEFLAILAIVIVSAVVYVWRKRTTSKQRAEKIAQFAQEAADAAKERASK